MAFEKDLRICAQFSAAVDLSTKQFYLVKLSGTTIDVCNTGTDSPLGVLQNKPSAGETADVAYGGISRISSDAALTAGNYVGSSADGQASAKTLGTESGHYVMGKVLVGTGAAGEIATVVLQGVATRAS